MNLVQKKGVKGVKLMGQQSLFDLSQYIAPKKNRGSYKKKEPKELNQYEEMALIYSQISNYLPIPIMMAQEQENFDFEYLTLWYSSYHNQKYEYRGEFYQGEEFKIIGAELKGTENFYIEFRLLLHKKLLELIQKGLNIQEAAKKLQPVIKYLHGATETDYGQS